MLRGEWGFEGTVLTDYQASLTREEVDQCLAAGGDLILNTAGLPLSSPDSDWSRAELRRAAHNILFTVVNSLAMNGFYHGATYSAGFPVYGILLIVLDVAAVAGVGVGLFFVLRKFLRSRKETPSDTTTAE